MSYRAFCESFLAALAAGDFETIGGMLDPGFTMREADGLPYGGVYEGVEGWRRLLPLIGKTWAGLKVRPIEFPAEGADALVVRLALSGRSRKTGRPFETTVMELWRFREGRLAEILPYYWDTHLLAEADRD
jgi:hypothetical protein